MSGTQSLLKQHFDSHKDHQVLQNQSLLGSIYGSKQAENLDNTKGQPSDDRKVSPGSLHGTQTRRKIDSLAIKSSQRKISYPTPKNKKARIECIDTPLHDAMRNLDTEQLKKLLNANANLTTVNATGHTPFQLLKKPNIKLMVEQIENYFLHKLSAESLTIEKISICNKAGDIRSLYLLVFLNSITHETLPKNDYMNGVHIQFRHKQTTNQEAYILAQMKTTDTCSNKPSLPPTLDGKTADQLFKEHSNLNIIASSERKSVGFGENHHVFHQPCYVLFCYCKSLIPYGESQFPKSIGGCPTDVREGYFTFGSNQQIQIGKSIFRRDIPRAGTIGGFVDLENGQTGLIACAHTFYALSELQSRNLPIDVPVTTAFAKEDFGKITRAVFTPDDPCTVSVDAVVVKIQDGNTAISNFPEISQIQLHDAGKFCNIHIWRGFSWTNEVVLMHAI